jgi:hypothetical protein
MYYNPNKPINSEEWLSLDETKRIDIVSAYHRKMRIELPNRKIHSVIHAIIENQLALEIPEVKDALVRLMADGLDRHDSIHAIGSVLAKHLYNALGDKPKDIDINEHYMRDVKVLTADSWLKEYG